MVWWVGLVGRWVGGWMGDEVNYRICMKEEWRCALIMFGEQCVMTLGTALMQLWSGIWELVHDFIHMSKF